MLSYQLRDGFLEKKEEKGRKPEIIDCLTCFNEIVQPGNKNTILKV